MRQRRVKEQGFALFVDKVSFADGSVALFGHSLSIPWELGMEP